MNGQFCHNLFAAYQLHPREVSHAFGLFVSLSR
jgi:hypothetical protein